MINFFGCIILSLTVFNFAFSQTEGEDIVRLKDGKEIRGFIIEQSPGQFIKVLQLPSRDTVKIDLSEIETLLKIVTQFEEKKIQDTMQVQKEIAPLLALDTTKINFFNQHLFQARLNFSEIFGNYPGEGFGMSLHRSLYSQFKLGLGFCYFSARIIIPYEYRRSFAFFTEAEHNLNLSTSGRFGFFSGLALGYNVDFTPIYKDKYLLQEVALSNGLYFHPRVGFRVNFSKNTGILLDVGYQYIHSNPIDPLTDIKLDSRNWSSVIFRFSLFF
jgi:hypothetical protein